MANEDRREHERIEIEMPTRMSLNEDHRGRQIVFEGFAKTSNLAIGGTFLLSDYVLPVGFPINLEMQLSGGELLVARGQVVHTVSHDSSDEPPGMGIAFTEVDAENRERLLRFFVSERIRDFYRDRFVVEFPHLESVLSLQDIALIINLWEDREGRVQNLKRSREAELQPRPAAKTVRRR